MCTPWSTADIVYSFNSCYAEALRTPVRVTSDNIYKGRQRQEMTVCGFHELNMS